MSSHWQSTISSGTLSRQVVGVTPGDWYSEAMYEPTDATDGFWKGLQDDEIGLSEIAASRLGAAAGRHRRAADGRRPEDLPGRWNLSPRMINDAAVGDIVLVSEELARTDWAAVRDQARRGLSVLRRRGRPPRRFRSPRRRTVRCTTTQQWRSVATTGITRFLEPLTIAAYVVMAAAGLSVLNVFLLGLVQRKRERAALRAIGVTAGQEQAVIIANAFLLGLLVACLAVLGGIGLTYLWSLGLTGVLRHQDSNGVCRVCRCGPEWQPCSDSSSPPRCIR